MIADPTRLAVVRYLSRSGPSTVRELTSAMGVHRHTLRHHLAVLRAAGVIEPAGLDRPGRGRPRPRVRLKGDWLMPTDDSRGLAAVLAEVVRAVRPSPGVLYRAGRAWGHSFRGGTATRTPVRDLPAVLEGLGFAAVVSGNEIRLSGCPCPLVLPGDPAVICQLMMAVVDGFLQEDAPKASRQIRASRHDPCSRACTLRL